MKIDENKLRNEHFFTTKTAVKVFNNNNLNMNLKLLDISRAERKYMTFLLCRYCFTLFAFTIMFTYAAFDNGSQRRCKQRLIVHICST